jgi:hypothetical protein
MIPAKLFDGSSPLGIQIASVRIETQRRATIPRFANKQDAGWAERYDGGPGEIEMRIIATGVMQNRDWIATLYDRQDTRTSAIYHVALVDGDSHTGRFMVEQLDEFLPPEEHRTFRLVLVSAGKIVYAATGSP